MPTVEETDRELDAAMDEYSRAQSRLHQARHQHNHAIAAKRLAELPAVASLTLRQLDERIRTHARDHRPGETDDHWILFRDALAELLARAEDRPRGPWLTVDAVLYEAGDHDGAEHPLVLPSELVFRLTREECAEMASSHLLQPVRIAVRRRG